MKSAFILLCATVCCAVFSAEPYFVRAFVDDKYERTSLVDAGVAIDAVFDESVTFIAEQEILDKVEALGIQFTATPAPQRVFNDFPSSDAAFHDYDETLTELKRLAREYPQLVTYFELGKSVEQRTLAGVRLSTNTTNDSLPSAVFIGCHHAREHISVEVPLLLAKHLAQSYGRNERVTRLLETREVWIVPMLNPDGAEYDIESGSYRYWRKNRRSNGLGSYGVDLNRNYGKGFGGSGSSSFTYSDIYRGPSAFSEPETQAVRDFLKAREKVTVLVSFHSFSELILWPWSHTYDELENEADRETFEIIGKKMATWNNYTPQKSSELYLASGDTTDWAYDELGIFAFTFELSPSSMAGGGFYPGAAAIQPTFEANIEPALYLIEQAENPYQVRETAVDPLGIL